MNTKLKTQISNMTKKELEEVKRKVDRLLYIENKMKFTGED